MRFTVERDELREALEVASLALKENSKEPIYAHYKVEVTDEGKASLEANSKFLYCRAGVDIESGDPGTMLIPGGSLKELAKMAESGPITFETGEDDTIVITSGQAKLNFPSLPAEDFLSPAEASVDASSNLYNILHLSEALKFMKVFIGTDKDKPQYMVTELRNDHWMASDGVRIGVYEREGFEGNFVIQTKALNPVLAFLKSSDCDSVKVTLTDQFCWFDDGQNKMAFRRDDRSFSVDIEKMLGSLETADHVKINRDFLEKIIQRLKIALDGGDTRMEFTITGDADGVMRVKTLNSRGKESIESFLVNRIVGEGEETHFALDWRPLLEVIQSDPFSEGPVDFFFVPSKNIVKLVKCDEGFEAMGHIALKP